MQLNKKERDKLIARIKDASGVAQYALDKKLTDKEVIKAAENLEVLRIIRPANNYNRYIQGKRTADANAKLKQFLNITNSEIYQTGQWLFDALSKVGQSRKESLLEKNLVHKEDYNNLAKESAQTIETVGSRARKQDAVLSVFRQELGEVRYSQIMKKYQIQHVQSEDVTSEPQRDSQEDLSPS